MIKNDILELTCEKLGSELEGIFFYEKMPIFVPGALPGELCRIHILKVQQRFAYGKLISVLKSSPERTAPFCKVYDQCGGCCAQHMAYAYSLQAKRQQVFDCLTRIGHLPISIEDVPNVLGAENPIHCRNKTAVPVGKNNADVVLGFYRKHSHSIVAITECPIAMPSLTPVLSAVQAWIDECRVVPYDEELHTGWLRHIVVRENRLGQLMLILCATSQKVPGQHSLLEKLKNRLPGLHSLHLSVNKENNNVILGHSSIKLWGNDTLSETLLGIQFEILPLSFFQVNPQQTEILYSKVIQFCLLKPSDIVIDAYAGAGTISLCMAAHCKQVIGIEIVPQAVESANRNKQINHIENAVFYNDAVENKLPKLIAEGLQPDVIVLDPPRKGVEQPVIDAVLKARPHRVVYVSCHVPTQARDLKLLYDGGYRVSAIQSVDMFCYAAGVENIVVMTIA